MSLSVLPADTLGEILARVGKIGRFIMSRTCRSCLVYAPTNIKRIGTKAASAGYLGVLMYLNDIGMKFEGYDLREAAGGGHIDCVDYLVRIGVPVYAMSICEAAGNGHVEILEYFYNTGYSPGTYDCERAVLGGHLNAVKYLRRFVNYDYEMAEFATERGQLHILRYLMEDCGVTLGRHHTNRDIVYRHANIVEYLHKRGGFDMDQVWASALHSDYDVDVVRYLTEAGVPIPPRCRHKIPTITNQEIIDILITAGYL